MADPNQGGGNEQQKQKGGGGGGAQPGLTLSGNINAAQLPASADGLKEMLCNHTQNAGAFIVAGLFMYMTRGIWRGLFGLPATSVPVKQEANPFEAVGALYKLKQDNPDRFKNLVSKHAALVKDMQSVLPTQE